MTTLDTNKPAGTGDPGLQQQPPKQQQPKQQEYEFHPIANIFPLITGEEFERFKADIETRKQQEPIWLHEGKILDGRNRYRACKELRLTPDAKRYEGDDPLGFVLSANLHRRHLRESQRALVAAKLARLPLGANQHNKEGTSIQAASKRLNVGKASVELARKVLDSGTPELVKAVEENRVAVSAAANKLLPKPPEEQKKILADKDLLTAAIKSNKTPLDRLEEAWDKHNWATQKAFVEAKYQDLRKLMKAVDQKQSA